MRAKKRPRAVRVGTPRTALTHRDFEIMTLAGLVGYLSSEQVGREFFQSQDRCRRRLRDLYDGGYLTVTLQDSKKPNLISLSRLALRTVSAERPHLGRRLRLAGAIRAAGVAHHLLVVDARLYAVQQGELAGRSLLTWSNAGGELGQVLGLGRFHLEPDGLAEFTGTERSPVIAVEVDRGTEPLGVLRRKFQRYREVMGQGLVAALWVVVDGGAGRRRALEAELGSAGLGGQALVLPGAALTERPVTALPRVAWGEEAGMKP